MTKSIVSINESLDLKLTETNKLLVYGSLRKEMDNHDLLDDSNYKETFVLDHCLMLQSHSFSFPFCLYSYDSKNTVVVESYQVSEEQLKYLDLVEGHPKFYHRTLITTNDNQSYWIYLIQPKTLLEYYSNVKFEIISDFVKYSLKKK